MVSRRFHIDLVFFSFFFSLLFCFCCSLVDNLLSFWVFLELCGMSLIPSFFYSSGSSLQGFYSSLLSYVVMSGLSSILLVSGIIITDLYFMIVVGFMVKFGLFPFSLWVYRVFSCSNWIFIFLLSVVSKFPILFFCYLLSSNVDLLLYWDCFMTILMCSCFFWFFSQSWEFIWCHISLSSVSTLIVACFGSDFFTSFFIYFYYFLWASLCIFYFNSLTDCEGLKNGFWWYCFLLLITPISLPLFYKLGVCFAILYSSLYVLLIWSVYSFSEQFFLYKLGGDYFYSSIYNNWLS
uniref:NADH dehydrogenase subunit 2 n=3 Tax=unclassified Rhinebothrium TaxID=2685310 RepID=A0A8K1W5Q3_9CEST|nr:NADH dehydrogenase subunit 2 [Rhinebothrium sp. MZUSP 8030]UFQ88980.1 NADH dehydrogenase subunit 2 [Rhinebothrium sp. MZUSP 8031]UFQ88992.1 NADH dehydrogenase subunit 2 [Rhinebothrium sp. MZUSP 8032]